MLHNFATSFLNYGLAASGPILQDVVLTARTITINTGGNRRSTKKVGNIAVKLFFFEHVQLKRVL